MKKSGGLMRFFLKAKGCCAAILLALGALPAGPVRAQMALNPEVKDQRAVRPSLTAPVTQPDAVKRQGVGKGKRTARKARRMMGPGI